MTASLLRPSSLRSPLRRLVASLGAVILLVSLMVAAPASPAGAAGGDLLYFGDGEPRMTAGANGVIRAHGALRSVVTCLPGGTNDFAFPASDIFIVAAGSARPFQKLAQADGTKPATVIGFGSSGAFLEEILAITGPQGALGEGTYDVVINNCQDGVYNPVYDSVFPGAITVQYPAVLPPYRDSIGQLKRQAAESAALWITTSILVQALKGAYEGKDPKSLVDAIITSPGWFITLIDEMVALKKKLTPASGGPAAVIQGTVDLAASQANRWLAIAEDPPDHDYRQPTVIEPIETLPAASAFGPKAALEGLAAPSATETALADAFLHALERYQGATYASDGEWALIHARELRQLALALAVASESTGEAVAELRESVGELTRWDETVYGMVVEAGRLRTGTWTPAQRQTLLNLGLTPEEMTEAHRVASDAGPFANAAGRTVAAMQENLGRLETGQGAMAAELRAYAERLEGVIAGLEAQSAVPRTAPVADAGGPYTAAVGQELAVDARASVAGTGGAISAYEWDLDGDGAFDDAAGESASFVPTVTTPGVIGVRVTAEDGAVSVAYAPLTLDRGDRPTIDNDGSVFLTAKAGEQFTLSVPFSGGTAQWLLDGEPAGSGDTFVFTPTRDDLGVFHLDLVVTAPHGGSAVENWYLSVVDVDDDADGWVATADCDDTDALVHPGRTEIPGNGVDDDCNPGTSDVPGDGMAGTVSSWGELPEVNSLVLGRSAGNVELSRTPADIRGLDGVRRVAAGHRMGLALTDTGALWAWGYGTDGQLGRGSNAEAGTPVAVTGLSGTGQLGVEGPAVTEMDSNRIGIALLADGTAAAWGPNARGALGTGSAATSRNVPELVRGPDGVLTDATAVAAAGTFAAVVSDGDVYVTGGACGTEAGRTAARVPGLPGPAVALAGGAGHLLIALADGTLHGCGANDRGQLGEGPAEIGAPVAIELGEDGARPARLAAGDGFSLVLDAAGTAWAWGRDDVGQLGGGAPGADRSVPRAVALPEGAAVTGLSAGGARAAVTRADGTLVTWGGGTATPTEAEQVAGGSAVYSAAVGDAGEVTYAVLSRSRPLVVWGTASYGTAGIGVLGDNLAPTVSTLPSFRDIRFNGVAGAGIDREGLVWSWGSASHLGAGHTGPGGPTRLVPGPVLGVGGAEGSQLRARAFGSHVGHGGKFAAILDGGQVAIWGSSGGHAGDGVPQGYRPHPTLVLDPTGTEPLTGVAQIAVATHGNLAVLEDGRVLGFGSGSIDPCKAPGGGNVGNLPVVIESVGDDIRQAVVQQTAGSAFFLTRDGELLSCGVNGYIGRTLPPNTHGWIVGQVQGMGPGEVAQVVAGLQSTLVLKTDGTVWGWGQDYDCALGCTEGQSAPDRVRPLPEQIHLPEGPRVVAIEHWTVGSFAIREDGSVLGWGWNRNGQIGLPAGTRVDVPTLIPMPGDRPVAAIDAAISGAFHQSLALAQVGDPLERLAEVRGPGIEASVADASVAEGDVARIDVTITHPARVDLEVAYETRDGSAAAGRDYVATSGSVVVPAGETTAVIEVPTLDDDIAQDGLERAFEVVLSSPPAWASLGDDVATVSISDDDPAPAVSVSSPAPVTEGHTGSRDVVFEVTLDRPSHAETSVSWRTVDGTAHSTGDYIGADGTLTFAPGQTSATVPVGVNGDTVLEPDETFTVELFDPRGVTIGTGTAEATIVDDEPVLVEASDQIVPAPAETVVVPFTISAPQLVPGDTVTVPWSVTAPWQEGDPTPDGVAGSGVVQLTAENPSAVVEVTVEAGEREAPQRFLLDVSAASASSGRDVIATRGTGTITPGELPPPVAAIAGPTEVAEGTTATYSAAASTGEGDLEFAWDLDGDGEFDDAATAEVDVELRSFGTRDVAVRVTDERGLADTARRTITVTNVAPALSPIDDAELAPGGTLRAEGTFADPGDNTWTATVDFGGGPEPLALDGSRFAIEHRFDRPGVFSVTVRVCDDGGACGATSFTVTVAAAPPAITRVSPDRGPESGGTRVSIAGTDLFPPPALLQRAAGQPSVAFGGVAGTDVTCGRVGGEDVCEVTTPRHAPGEVDVTVTTPAGTATAPRAFAYEALPAPDPDPQPGPDPQPDPEPDPTPDPDPDPTEPAPDPTEPVGPARPDGGPIAATGGTASTWLIAAALLALLAGSVLLGRRRAR
ncbi:Calx-beta domain-containing protein [Microbacterium album]|uniref:PKD domain-containing protein n=1 Tax=Microbacterium album TaxID=2053191 RepID=A0A917MLZ3_9MICO|nr:Calx-beta domain-containing protein [Microbacterium album]GGH45595.1 hypothetical protein GCM10010921_21090 [Microbacterium album]